MFQLQRIYLFDWLFTLYIRAKLVICPALNALSYDMKRNAITLLQIRGRIPYLISPIYIRQYAGVHR